MQIMKQYRKIFEVLMVLPLTIAFLFSCQSDSEEVERPEKIYYDQAQRRMSSGNYMGAIESLETIESRYPFGKYAEQAQVELIYAHLMNSEPEAAHSAAEKFIRLHPRHPNIDYAYFLKGLSSYTRDNNFLVRITGTDLSNRDISGAKESFAELAEFLTRFPESQYGPYAKQRSIYLRNMIAKNELAAADYYMTRKAYIAAIRRASYVIENIPGSNQNLRALKILLDSYDSLGYTDLYNDTKKIIELNYVGTNNSVLEDSWSWEEFGRIKP